MSFFLSWQQSSVELTEVTPSDWFPANDAELRPLANLLIDISHCHLQALILRGCLLSQCGRQNSKAASMISIPRCPHLCVIPSFEQGLAFNKLKTAKVKEKYLCGTLDPILTDSPPACEEVNLLGLRRPGVKEQRGLQELRVTSSWRPQERQALLHPPATASNLILPTDM